MNVRKLQPGNFPSEFEGIVIEGECITLVEYLRDRSQ